MFELTFLGTAASTPSPERGLPALVVAAGRARFLVDCGEGTQRQLLRAGIGFRRLRHILLTHNHLDHVLGLGGLIATLALVRAAGDLVIRGSGETLDFVEHYLAALWPRGRSPLPVALVRLADGDTIEEEDCRISCFAVRHRGTQSLGFRFAGAPRRHLRPDRLRELSVPAGRLRSRLAAGEPVVLADGRQIDPDWVLGPPTPATSLVVIGDCEETATLVERVRGADALVIEATFLDEDRALAAERGHLTAAEAGRLAAEAAVGRLYLTHLSGRYPAEAVVAEAGRLFPRAAAAADFDRVRIPG